MSRTRRRRTPKRRELVPLLGRAHRDGHRVEQRARLRPPPRPRLRARAQVLRSRARPCPPAAHRRLQRASACRSRTFPSGKGGRPRLRRIDVPHRHVALALPSALSRVIFRGICASWYEVGVGDDEVRDGAGGGLRERERCAASAAALEPASDLRPAVERDGEAPEGREREQERSDLHGRRGWVGGRVSGQMHTGSCVVGWERTWPKLVMLFSPAKRQLAWIWISDAGCGVNC